MLWLQNIFALCCLIYCGSSRVSKVEIGPDYISSCCVCLFEFFWSSAELRVLPEPFFVTVSQTIVSQTRLKKSETTWKTIETLFVNSRRRTSCRCEHGAVNLLCCSTVCRYENAPSFFALLYVKPRIVNYGYC